MLGKVSNPTNVKTVAGREQKLLSTFPDQLAFVSLTRCRCCDEPFLPVNRTSLFTSVLQKRNGPLQGGTAYRMDDVGQHVLHGCGVTQFTCDRHRDHTLA